MRLNGTKEKKLIHTLNKKTPKILYFGRFFVRIVLLLKAGCFFKVWACSSVVERYPDKIEVEGSIPSTPIGDNLEKILGEVGATGE